MFTRRKIANIDNALEQEKNELWLRYKIVHQLIELRDQLGYSNQDVANIMGVSKQLMVK